MLVLRRLVMFGLSFATVAVLFFFVLPRKSPPVSSDRSSSPDAAGRRIVCDFGVVRPAIPVEKTLVIENSTPFDWKLDEIIASCGCAVASVSPEFVASGASAQVKVRYVPSIKAATDQRTIDLIFGGASRCACRVLVHAEVRPELTVLPPSMVLRRTAANGAGAVRVLNYGADRWSGLSVTSRKGLLLIDAVSELPATDVPPSASQGFEVSFHVDAGAAPLSAPAFDLLDIATRGIEPNVVAEVPVEIAPVDQVRLYPSYVVIDGTAGSKMVLVELPEELARHVDSLAFVPDGDVAALDAEWSPIGNNRWKVRLDIAHIARMSGDGEAKINLSVSGQKVADLRVQFVGDNS